MYAIAQVIYGIPLESPDLILEESLAGEEPGFLEYYSGSGDTPAAFGVEIDSFDECCHHIFVRDLKLTPTAQQEAEYRDLWDQQPQEIQEALCKIAAEPEVFILWSTS